ncbi:DUF433 domain-containing protein [Rhodopseudomonas sp. B29]|uniref:DUF433 domain-containing protein n=1 Tax=Rhodopseudomonas sp. B29 TaxID=95607 RepID=UPI001FCB88D2|nr:DUF433 domain-containing protein [Rhodopseudomonas sp. B29]
MSDLLPRIKIDPGILHGRPCIRGLRISVADVLGRLSVSASRQDNLSRLRSGRQTTPSSRRNNRNPACRYAQAGYACYLAIERCILRCRTIQELAWFRSNRAQ